jgi:DNA repair exonuclease SbcCD ATPase subunit
MSVAAYLIFLAIALTSCGLGAVGAFFYYRARNREAVLQLEARDQDLAEREEELRRIQYRFTNAYPAKGPAEAQASRVVDSPKLQEELEQKKNDLNILKQDFDLETGILKQEVEQLRKEKSEVDRSRRQVARKESELDSLEAELERRRLALEATGAELQRIKAETDRSVAAIQSDMDSKLARRSEELESQNASRRHELDQRHREIDAVQKSLRSREEQLDEDIANLSQDKFTSRQEAVLIKRLRQQIKLQREELEHMHTLCRRTEAALDALRSHVPSTMPPRPPMESPELPSFSTISDFMDSVEEE